MNQFQNSAQPPSAPANRPVGQNSDLYAQISAEDVDTQVVKKKNKSFFLTIISNFMRATLYIDSLRRTHEPFFHFLGAIWTLFMALLYCSGVLMLGFSVYNRLQLPIYLEDQLRLRNVQFESAEYGMDRIIVHNLRDQDNIYTVENMTIYSTFTDLLQKRIRLVVLEGLNIFVDTKSDPDLLSAIPQFLSQIQNPTKGRLDIAVNAITVNNAKLTFKNRQIDVPISFSMEGIYGNNTQIVIPVFIDQPSLQVEGTLTIGGDRSYPEWILSISKGKVTLPRSAPEDLTGEIKVTLDHQELETVQAGLKFGYGTIQKNLTTTLKKQGEKSLSGNILWERNNTTEPEFSSNLSLQVDNLEFSAQGTIKTKGSLIVDSKQFYTNNVALRKLHAPLDARVECTNWTQCEVHVNKSSTITVQEIEFPFQRQEILSTEQTQFDIQPQRNALFISDTDPYLTFDLPIQNLSFKGIEKGTANAIEIEAPTALVRGSLTNEHSETSQIFLQATDFSYYTPSLSFKKAILKMDNLLQQTSKTTMQAQDVQFSEIPLLSQPFNLNFNMLGNQATAQLNFNELPIKLQLEGKFSPTQKAFSGKIYAPPFNLKDINVPIHTLMSGIPNNFKNYSGEVTLDGEVTWLGLHNISGPLKIGLKDISFDTEHSSVKGLNSVITADTVIPFTSKQNQHLFIQSIRSLIPFQNIDVIFQADAQSLKLNRFTALGAGIPLTLPSSVISSKGANLVNLKNEKEITPTIFQQVISIPDIDITAGTASLSIPIEIQGNNINISNITMKIQNALLQKQNDRYANVFETSKNYFVRTGQLILDENKVLQLALSGKLLPSRQQKDLQLNAKLSQTLFNPIVPKQVPTDIQDQLKALFKH